MDVSTQFPLSQALISVSDKTNLENIGQVLSTKNIDILASGGTAKYLSEHNIPNTKIEEYTNQSEILGGRVKTLHPKIFGGILARSDNQQDQADLNTNNIVNINLVIANLYPFEEQLKQNNLTDPQKLIEFIDIGGASLIRAAAKNFEHTIIIVDPNDYEWLQGKLIDNNKAQISFDERLKLAQKAFALTAHYEACISDYFKYTTDTQDLLNQSNLHLNLEKYTDLRYGENPDQSAAVYTYNSSQSSLANCKPLQGKELSYNNLLDSNAGINIINSLNNCSELKNYNNCVIVKHNSPCGVASSSNNIIEAYDNAFKADSRSAFGGIIVINKKLTTELADIIISNQFLEVLIAPEVDNKALEILKTKPNVRLIKHDFANNTLDSKSSNLQIRSINGGLLVQTAMSNKYEFNIVTQNKNLSNSDIINLKLSWHTVQNVKSNAIVLVKDSHTIGIGGGQTSRIGSIELAAHLAKTSGFETKDSVLASDAFFPFEDSVELAHKLGITAIIQPGGSKNDSKIIAKANQLGITMVFTNNRKFCH